MNENAQAAFTPFQQDAAQVLTVAAIDIGAADNATKLARAQVALLVAAVFQTAGTGDIPGASDQLSALVLNIKDPGIALVARNLWAIGRGFLTAESVVLEKAPLLGATVNALLAETAAGMQAVANAYVQALTPPAQEPNKEAA